MVDLKALNPKTLQALEPAAMAELAPRMLAQLSAQSRQIQQHQEAAQRYEREIKLKDAKLEKITFELARLKAWKFGARTERMNAQQRQMFEDTAHAGRTRKKTAVFTAVFKRVAQLIRVHHPTRSSVGYQH